MGYEEDPLSWWSISSMRWMKSSVSSTGETCLDLMRSRRSVAEEYASCWSSMALELGDGGEGDVNRRALFYSGFPPPRKGKWRGGGVTLTLASPIEGEGMSIGVLCFSLGSRLRGNDGGA